MFGRVARSPSGSVRGRRLDLGRLAEHSLGSNRPPHEQSGLHLLTARSSLREMALELCLGVAFGSGLLLLATQESAQAYSVQTVRATATTEKASGSVGEPTEELPQKPAAQAPSSPSRVRRHSVTRAFVGRTVEPSNPGTAGVRVHRLVHQPLQSDAPASSAALPQIPWTSLYAASCFFPSGGRSLQSGGPFAWGLGSSLGMFGDPRFIAQMIAPATVPNDAILAPTAPVLLAE